jgi:hypothetical protein
MFITYGKNIYIVLVFGKCYYRVIYYKDRYLPTVGKRPYCAFVDSYHSFEEVILDKEVGT